MVFSANSALASRSFEAPECKLQGIVLSENERSETGQGLSEGHTYHYLDLTIKIENLSYTDPTLKTVYTGKEKPYNCEFSGNEILIYQKKDVPQNSQKNPSGEDAERLTGKCITAKTQFFGDGNFMSGNWLYDIQILNDDACQDSK
tara:strand:+ start:341 stop:778 length:438 start_codon:yes stop_codon:yes gene_type:complete